VKLYLFFWLLLPFFSRGQTSFSMTLPDTPIPHPVVIDTAVDNWNHSFKSYTLLNPQEKELIYWVNYSRINPKRFWDSVVVPILKIIPDLKSGESQSLKQALYQSTLLPLFSIHPNLENMAKPEAAAIGKHAAAISHTSPDGKSFIQRFQENGFRSCGGENICLSDDMLLGLVLLYIDLKVPESGHRKNLLSKEFTNIGIGSAKYGNTDNYFFVQDFACP
jgi:hypothetical protein